jgi:CHASE2 domain-containing sensor protein
MSADVHSAVCGAVRDVLADEYAVGDDEGVAAISEAAIRAASFADMRQWTVADLDALLTKLGYARCSAVGHEGYLRTIKASAGAREGAENVSSALDEASIVIGILRAALREQATTVQPPPTSPVAAYLAAKPGTRLAAYFAALRARASQ